MSFRQTSSKFLFEGRHPVNSIVFGDWNLVIEDGGLPPLFNEYLQHADFVDQIDVNNADGRFYFLGICKREASIGWPSVISVQKYQIAQQAFSPGILIVHDTSLVFVGAGDRLLCYDIDNQKRLWEDETSFGFWGWAQFGTYVLMSAELEFAVWNQSGQKLWSTFVEPPWNFEVRGQTVELNVMGKLRLHRLSDGKLLT